MNSLFLSAKIGEVSVFTVYALFLLAISFATFLFYGADKRRAEKGAWRVPEKVLLFLSIFGGAFGAIIAMKVFRHKTKHWYFTVVNVLGVVIHAGLLILTAFVI